MKQKVFFLLVLFMCLKSWSQTLVYKGSGTVTNQKNTVLTPNLVRIALAEHPDLLKEYNIGRRKKTVGNTMLLAGPVLIGVGTMAYVISNFDSGMNPGYAEPRNTVPKIMMGTGLAAMLIAIPVKIGFSKKVKNSISQYNNRLETTSETNNNNLEIVGNTNGLGLRLTLN
ncbi:hypothetical protein [Flavobacterium sp. GNP001]